MADVNETRERSTIRFPYGDLNDAITIARTVHEQFGTSCDLDQLAGAMRQSLSGAFRNKVATASTFGVIDTVRGGVTLTDLGERTLDPQTAADAAAEAFLTVPLYQAVYDKFRGRQLPSDQGFEAEIVRLGVSPKVVKKARQALQRSAEQAGFFRHGRERLVQPAATSMPTMASTVIPDDLARAMSTEFGGAPLPAAAPGPQHPMLVGLWQELPTPKTGDFGPDKQREWLDAAKVVLKLLYGGEASPEPSPAPRATPEPE